MSEVYMIEEIIEKLDIHYVAESDCYFVLEHTMPGLTTDDFKNLYIELSENAFFKYFNAIETGSESFSNQRKFLQILARMNRVKISLRQFNRYRANRSPNRSAMTLEDDRRIGDRQLYTEGVDRPL